MFYLLQGGNISSPNQDGRTALHVAAASGNLHVVQYLLHQGASVHIKDYRGDNPLIDAIFTKNLEVIRLLVQTGAVLPWPKSRISMHLCRLVKFSTLLEKMFINKNPTVFSSD